MEQFYNIDYNLILCQNIKFLKDGASSEGEFLVKAFYDFD
jgi:hypothetical protein